MLVALKGWFLLFGARFKVWALKGLAFSGLASALDCFGSADFPAPLTVLFWIGIGVTSFLRVSARDC